jgi:lipoyl(octanoyl) transferase
MPYNRVLDIQKRLFEEMIVYKQNCDKNEVEEEDDENEQSIIPTLIFCEHPHVYTLGKNGEKNNLLINDFELSNIGAEFIETDRGGDITYHGPGQLVIYPIFDLDLFGIGVKDFVLKLENIIIELLKKYGIKGNIIEDKVGVWIDVNSNNERKICSLGIRESRKITMHGIALNVSTDLTYFDKINPCGYTDKKATSLQKETGQTHDMQNIKNEVKLLFKKVFDIEFIDI